VCNNFPWQFHFFWVPSMKKIILNPTVKVCKIWCYDVYMYILYCDIFGWKLIDRIFQNQKYQGDISGHPPFFQFQLFNVFSLPIEGREICSWQAWRNAIFLRRMHLFVNNIADPDISDYEFDADDLFRRQLYCIWKFHGINWRFDCCKSSLLSILMQYWT
jgi:hypothetical protein